MLDYKLKVALKYCGSCNPQIDLSGVGHLLKETVEKEEALLPVSLEGSKPDVVIVLCGCARACGNTEEIRARAPRSIVVAGKTVDLAPVAEDDIGTTVMKKLLTECGGKASSGRENGRRADAFPAIDNDGLSGNVT